MSKLSRRDAILQIISDVHKDAYGFRPREDYSRLTDAQLESLLAQFSRAAEEEIERERAQQSAAEVRWEADIAKLVADQKVTKARAILWDMAAHETDFGFDQYCWARGLSYAFETKLKDIFAQEGLTEADACAYVGRQREQAA